jgi:la-related protein 6
MNNFLMNNQAQYGQATKSQNDMSQMFAMNPALLYQNQFNLYQALQDPATVALLIQQQQALQQQLQAQQAAQVQSASIGRGDAMGMWAQRSQQLYGQGKNMNKRDGRNKNKQQKAPKLRPDEGEMILPDGETQAAIIEAAEFYFSNENLAKDHYLLRQICQKSEGFLSIKLLTALKNVKKLTKDWRVTAFCLKNSEKLQLNEEGTKVRRIDALPEYVLKARTITNVLCIKMPKTLGSVGAVTAMFSEFGHISLVRVLLEGKPVPCDLRNYATQVPDMGTTLCAVVEFETEEEATKCVKELNMRQNEAGMRAALLGPRLRRNLYKVPTEEEKEAELLKLANSTKIEGGDSGCDSASIGDDADVSGATSDASSSNHIETTRNKRLQKRKDRGTDDLQSVTSSEDYCDPRPWSKTVEGSTTASSSAVSTTCSESDSDKSPYRLRQLSVIREPRGPDGTRGFHGGASKWNRKPEPL